MIPDRVSYIKDVDGGRFLPASLMSSSGRGGERVLIPLTIVASAFNQG